MSLRILTVCTANVCRSPMAAALLDRHCQEHGIDAVVRSAGIRAGIAASDPEAITVMAERGIDIAGHSPRMVTRAVADEDGADLIVTMARLHLREVATMGPGLLPRTFTVKELARRTRYLANRDAGNSFADMSEWRSAVGRGRVARDLLGDDPADDLVDPYGQSKAVHRRTADELDALTASIAASLAAWLEVPNSAASDRMHM